MEKFLQTDPICNITNNQHYNKFICELLTKKHKRLSTGKPLSSTYRHKNAELHLKINRIDKR